MPAAGVEVGTEQAWRFADESDLPRMMFIDKMDRENANFARRSDPHDPSSANESPRSGIRDQVQEAFKGVVDLLTDGIHVSR